jgi:hypothetical protein
VISNILADQTDPALRNCRVSTALAPSQKLRFEQCTAYREWCQWCCNQAIALNAAAKKWVDWNGVECDWRAVDVERAFFALG